MNKQKLAKDLIKFIDDSPSNYFACINAKEILNKNGFTELSEAEEWKLKKGEKYYVTINDSGIIAFTIGTDKIYKSGYRIAASHTDSPGFLIKPNPEMNKKDYDILNTEVYGGPILSTWFDRPLSFSGRVFVEGDSAFKPKKYFINYDKDLFIIPSLCIHQNRGVNDGMAINAQKDTLPLVNISRDKNKFSLTALLAKELKVKESEILSYDLSLHSREKGCILGANDEFVSVGRLDNLAAFHASLNSLIDNKEKE